MVLPGSSESCGPLDIAVSDSAMPYASLRKCTYPGCNVLVKSGRCAAHSTKRIIRDPAIKKLYNSPRWQSMRAAQLTREPWCLDCLKQDNYIFATEVDHVIPHNGDPQLFFDANNLQSLCKQHHSSKTASEVLHPSNSIPPVKESLRRRG